MFSTFTGSSKRPRNVNLSGSTGNSFSNTSWTPSAASNTTRAVTDAQAERERRFQDRQRIKAAARIQQTWRGHKSRRDLAEDRRSAFDDIYSEANALTWNRDERMILASSLLVFFFSEHREDDLRRINCFIRDAVDVGIDLLVPPRTTEARTHRLCLVLAKTLQKLAQSLRDVTELQNMVEILGKLLHKSPRSILGSLSFYFEAIEELCGSEIYNEYIAILIQSSLSTILEVSDEHVQDQAYNSLAFGFMSKNTIGLFERHIKLFCNIIDPKKLSHAIIQGYSSGIAQKFPRDTLLQLLAHFIDCVRNSDQSSQFLVHLDCLNVQVAFLSSDIILRMNIANEPQEDSNVSGQYVNQQLKKLVGSDGISRLVRDFSRVLVVGSGNNLNVDLLASFILSLLRAFPGSADDTRMKLFLEDIRTSGGEIPVVRYLWDVMQRTSVFQQIVNQRVTPLNVLRKHVRHNSLLTKQTQEEQDWKVIRLFLELYTFVLRLSDDEDFFSGIYPHALRTQNQNSRLQACSLSLQDVKLLTSFLKVVAFTLHYKAHEISKTQQELNTDTNNRFTTYLGSTNGSDMGTAKGGTQRDPEISQISRFADIKSLKDILTITLKMVYERDSRKPFLPANHWLMTENFDTDDFTNAVLVEEQQRREAEDSEDENEHSEDDAAASMGSPGVEVGPFASYATARLSRHARQERMKSHHKRAQRERRRAEMGPKLEILKHMPFVVPFHTRVHIFRQFVELERISRDPDPGMRIGPFTARHQGQIRRGQIFEDAFQAFDKLGEGFKDHIQITFVDQFDAPEAGIDGGGVTKEFLTSVIAEAFNNEDGGLEMFSSSEKGLLYPNPSTLDTLREALRQEGYSEANPEWRDALTNLVKRYEFLGRIIGKCMYEGILVDLAFAGFFLLKWPSAGPNQENTYKGSVNDLRDMDDELYRGMLRLKNYDGNIADLGFDFTIEDQVSRPNQPIKTVNRKLIPDGDNITVTNDNRLLYIFHVARHRLVVQPSIQTTAFLRGLRAIIRPSWLSMFNQSELQRLVGGDSSEIDVEDLRKNTHYSGLYEVGDDGEEHPTIKLFWKVMHEFSDTQRREVIKYVSSTPRAPLLGFSQLKPKFSIRDSGSDQARLPSTSTCVNLLKLPRYTSEKILRDKLLYAIQSGAGFDLS